MLYASRDRAQILLRPELRALLEAHAGRFELRHFLSREPPAPPAPRPDDGGAPQCAAGGGGDGECVVGERVTAGRVDAAAVRESFGDGWGESAYFLVVGTKEMERAAWSWLDELGYSRRLLSGSARWAPFVPA